MASDTSLIFNILAKENVSRALNAVRSAFTSTGRQAEEAMTRATRDTSKLDSEIQRVEHELAQLSAQFAATGDKTLFAKISRDRSLLNQLRQIRKSLDDTDNSSRRLGDGGGSASTALRMIGGAASAAHSSLASVGGSAMSLAGSIWGLVAVLGALGAAFAVAGPAAYALGGAIGALPGIVAGAAAAIGTLKLGFFGLSKEYNRLTSATGGGGGGAGKAVQDLTPKLRAVEAAERDVKRATRELAEAQIDARRAQEAINDAREEAVERMEDLNRNLREARMDEADSVAEVAEAEYALNQARARGNPEEIEKAQRAYDRAKLSLEGVQDRVGDLTKEQEENAEKGVEGSDEMVQARERERQAVMRVKDAEEQRAVAIQRLADAQADLAKKESAGGGGGGGGQEITKLAPSAREFLNTILALRPAFERLRLNVQQRLFQGLADKMQTLADRWLPQLNTSLVDMAGTFNDVFKTLFDSLSKPKFIDNMATAIESVRTAIGRVGKAVAGPLVDAFGRMARAAGPFIETLGEKIAEVVEHFSGWIKELDESGSLDKFFKRAGEVVSDVFDIFEDLFSIAGSVMSIIFGTEEESDYSSWDSFVVTIDKIAAWFKNPENQKSIKDWMLKFEQAVNTVAGVVITVSGWIGTISGWVQKFAQAKENVTQFLDGVRSKVDGWVRAIGSVPGKVGQALASLPGVVSRAVSSAIRWFQTMGSRAWDAVRNVGKSVTNALSDLGSRLWSSGQNAVRGLWNGISSMGGWLWSKVYNFAGGINDAIKAKLGISSPSKVMAEEVGRWIPPGIAAGMDATAGTVLDAVARISDTLAGTTLAAPSVAAIGATGSGTGPAMVSLGAPAGGSGGRDAAPIGRIEVSGDREVLAFLRRIVRVHGPIQFTSTS